MNATPLPYTSLLPGPAPPATLSSSTSIKAEAPSSEPWIQILFPLFYPFTTLTTAITAIATELFSTSEKVIVDLQSLTVPSVILLLLSLALAYIAIRCLYHYILYRRAMESALQNPFPFMSLPPELRDMVYENLLEDPYYPAPAPCAKHSLSDMMSWMMPSTRPSSAERNTKQCNWILLANKQIYAEFMDLICKKRVFHLTVSPENYAVPALPEVKPSPPFTTPVAVLPTSSTSTSTTTPATPTTPPPAAASKSDLNASDESFFAPATTASPTSTPSPSSDQRIWNVSPTIMAKVRRCDIKLNATSAMLGVPDPRNLTPSTWALASKVRSELSAISLVRELNVHVKAIGDPLWNPLWVWYHSAQSFKTMGSEVLDPATGEVTKQDGPRVSHITFSLDTWSPGENYLQRVPESGDWAWYCTEGHCVGSDGGPEMTVRGFCARMYVQCRTCHPELDTEDEEEEEDEEVEGDDEEVGAGDVAAVTTAAANANGAVNGAAVVAGEDDA